MAGLPARATGSHWVIPSVAATALHAAALCYGIFGLAPTPSDVPSAPLEVVLEASVLSAPPTAASATALQPERDLQERDLQPTAHLRPTPASLPQEDADLRQAGAPTARVAKASRHASARRSPPDQVAKVEPAPSRVATRTEDATSNRVVLSAAKADSPMGSPEKAESTGSAATGAAPAARVAHSSGSPAAPNVTKPRLLSSGAACHGLLLASPLSTPTKVTMVLRVGKDGTALPTAVHAESDANVPGLELAAQRCAQRLRFIPARSQDGATVTASSVVKLTFSNHYTATLPPRTKARHGAI